MAPEVNAQRIIDDCLVARHRLIAERLLRDQGWSNTPGRTCGDGPSATSNVRIPRAQAFAVALERWQLPVRAGARLQWKQKVQL